MGHQTFNDSQTQLDINGPLLSFTKNPSASTSMLTVSPATSDGDTTINLETSNDSFDADTTYTFTALNTFTAGVRLYGAAGGKNGGKGGSVSGDVKFESGVSYVLEVGKVGSQNGTVGVGSGGTGGANGGSGGGYTGLFRASVSQANALLIAGGGGGGSGGITTTGLGNAGGFGGGVEGGTAKGPSGLLDGAGGGTQIGGGRKGPASLDETGGITNTSGGDLEGGTGESNILYSGGGGGGGYYGGGGGRGDIDTDPGSWGGGGGSGFISTNTDYVMAGSGGFWTAENESGGSAVINSVFSVGSTRIFTGIATVGFSTSGYTADNAGDILYQWYEVGVGKLTDSSVMVGTATTMLTIYNLTENDNGRKFYLETDYLPNYDASRVNPFETGQAWNEPHSSTVGIVTVKPFIDITNQPTDDQALVGDNTAYSITATSAESQNLSYQWQLNGSDATSGTVTRTTATNYYSTINSVDFSHSIPSGSTNVQIVVAGGSGGKGGAEDSNDPGGEGGAGFVGRFALPDGEQSIEVKIGRRGDDGVTGADTNGGIGGTSMCAIGGNGGASAPSPASGGGGGGGGGATAVWISGIGTVILAAGGGGGGGGSEVYDGLVGSASTYWFDYTPSEIVSLKIDGSAGEAAPLAGGGGGGGGAGISGGTDVVPFGGGGTYGQDEISASAGGIAGGSAYSSATAGLKSFWENTNKTGYVVLEYNTSGSDQTQVTTNTVVSGGDTPTFTVNADKVGIQTVQCVISHPTATNSPLKSNVVNFASVSSEDQFNINIEEIGNIPNANLSSINLSNGEHTFDRTPVNASTLGLGQLISFYAPDRDLNIEMDLYGGKGLDSTDNTGAASVAFKEGGEGGYSRIRFTMKKNEEYVIAGLTDLINAPFVYRKATLIAVVGQGGGGGSVSTGGKGGGINVSTGESGFGRDGGIGAVAIQNGQLTERGVFGSRYPNADLRYFGDTIATGIGAGGRALTCSQGIYWSDRGIGACSDMSGDQFFRLERGTPVTNTAEITRGFKAGFNIMQTAGSAVGTLLPLILSGSGGHGATGGNGGQNGAGGGGGAGYTDGSVTVVDTQLGGSTGNCKVVIRSVT